MAIENRIQDSNWTAFDRYPDHFKVVSDYALLTHRGIDKLKLLSFGCSTGEEIRALDEIYLQGADLTGVDIDSESISEARKKCIGSRNSCFFYHVSDDAWKAKYNVVMAMSVLCNWPTTRRKLNINSLYSFASFNEQVEQLDQLLDVGGLLVIHNSNYFFEDTSIYQKNYRPYGNKSLSVGFVKRFDVNGWRYINHRFGSNFFIKVGS